MSSTSPNFEYWRRFSAYSIYEASALMAGIDPRAMSDLADAEGDELILDDVIKELLSAVEAQEVVLGISQNPPFTPETLITKSSFLEWLPGHGFIELAEELADCAQVTLTNQPLDSGEKLDWRAKAKELADTLGQERWDRGERQITARNICDAVQKELAKLKDCHGLQGPRGASDVRNRGLKGWKFDSKTVD